MTDRGTEYCGKADRHDYQLFLAINDIEHTKTKVKHWQTDAICKRLFVSTPNGLLWGNSIKNYTKNGKLRIDIIIGISYSDSIDRGISVLSEIAKNEKRFLQEPSPIVMVASLAESSVNLQLRGWVKIEDYWQVNWDLNKLIKEGIEKAGLSIPFPQRAIHIQPQPELQNTSIQNLNNQA